jgi:hypothetical protein
MPELRVYARLRRSIGGGVRKLTPEIIKNLSSDQVELLLQLGDLARSEWELTGKIDEMRKQADKVGWKGRETDTKAIHEDSEFDELISLRLVREREIIRDKISALMKSIAEAGLGDLGLIARQAPNYGIDFKKKE